MKRILLALLAVAAALPLAGCSSSGDSSDYNPDKIAVKQPGNGPPPMNSPMGDQAKTKGP